MSPIRNALLDTLLRRYVESQVYQGVVENLASEQAATYGGDESRDR